MKKTLILFIVILLLQSGCIYRNVHAPGYSNKNTSYQMTTEDFKIIGTVKAEGTIHNILLFISWGGKGISELEKKAAAIGADDIINYTFDVKSLGFFFIIYNSFKWEARATAIKYTNRAINAKEYNKNWLKRTEKR